MLKLILYVCHKRFVCMNKTHKCLHSPSFILESSWFLLFQPMFRNLVITMNSFCVRVIFVFKGYTHRTHTHKYTSHFGENRSLFSFRLTLFSLHNSHAQRKRARGGEDGGETNIIYVNGVCASTICNLESASWLSCVFKNLCTQFLPVFHFNSLKANI